jgi:hypothetical protein
MTQGVIVYVLGRGEPPAAADPGTCCQGLGNHTGRLEIVVTRPGLWELDDAWHFLLAKGCEPIHLLVTHAEQDYLRPLYPLVRLTGVARRAERPSWADCDGMARQ